MKGKEIILLAAVAIAMFFAGYFIKSTLKSKPESQPATPIPTSLTDSPKTLATSIDTVDKPIPESASSGRDFRKILKGKYILKGADWAGYDFVDEHTVTWTNELFPMDPDTMRLQWINKSSFFTVFTRFIKEDCPPRLWVCTIESLVGDKLVIRELETGWSAGSDELKVFYFREKVEGQY